MDVRPGLFGEFLVELGVSTAERAEHGGLLRGELLFRGEGLAGLLLFVEALQRTAQGDSLPGLGEGVEFRGELRHGGTQSEFICGAGVHAAEEC